MRAGRRGRQLLLAGGISFVLIASAAFLLKRTPPFHLAFWSRSQERTDTYAASLHEAEEGIPLSVPGLLGNSTLQIHAKAGIALDIPSGNILTEVNGFTPLPIASLTKLMSAMVALDHHVNLTQEITIAPDEFTVGGNLRILPNADTITVRDALFASITGSANNATLALARSTGLSREDFVREMNRKAVMLGLEHLHFVDPTGLSPENRGTAYEVARLAAVALTQYPLLRDAASRGEYALRTQNTQREHVIKNPNGLFQRSPRMFQASKTGYLDESLYCLMLAKDTAAGLIVAVTLGHPSKEGSEEETLSLLTDASGRIAGALDMQPILRQ